MSPMALQIIPNYLCHQVIRKSTGVKLFDTSDMPGFVYSDQFIQIATNLPSTAVYGLGENEQPTYRHDLQWKTWTGFARCP